MWIRLRLHCCVRFTLIPFCLSNSMHDSSTASHTRTFLISTGIFANFHEFFFLQLSAAEIFKKKKIIWTLDARARSCRSWKRLTNRFTHRQILYSEPPKRSNLTELIWRCWGQTAVIKIDQVVFHHYLFVLLSHHYNDTSRARTYSCRHSDVAFGRRCRSYCCCRRRSSLFIHSHCSRISSFDFIRSVAASCRHAVLCIFVCLCHAPMPFVSCNRFLLKTRRKHQHTETKYHTHTHSLKCPAAACWYIEIKIIERWSKHLLIGQNISITFRLLFSISATTKCEFLFGDN